jgi:general secretion pathway protein I
MNNKLIVQNCSSPYLKRVPQQCGFSLLEILVAFSILAVSLGIILKIFSSGLQSTQVAENYTLAVTIAESLLAKTGEDKKLALGETRGQTHERFNWLVQVTEIAAEIIPPLPDSFTQQVVHINVTVSWNTDPPRSIRLTTVKLMSTQE